LLRNSEQQWNQSRARSQHMDPFLRRGSG
jgi:hypothetical protein